MKCRSEPKREREFSSQASVLSTFFRFINLRVYLMMINLAFVGVSPVLTFKSIYFNPKEIFVVCFQLNCKEEILFLVFILMK